LYLGAVVCADLTPQNERLKFVALQFGDLSGVTGFVAPRKGK
jgi:hypothetical protein